MFNQLCGEEQPLEQVVASNGQVPQNFPASITAVHQLTGAQIDALLVAYQLPTNGSVATRRGRLMRFLGRRP